MVKTDKQTFPMLSPSTPPGSRALEIPHSHPRRQDTLKAEKAVPASEGFGSSLLRSAVVFQSSAVASQVEVCAKSILFDVAGSLIANNFNGPA